MNDALADPELKPYLVRAVYQWCVESGRTPYLAARADNGLGGLPDEFAADGRIIFNIGADAVRGLVINADKIAFSARFRGATRAVEIPLCDVLAIFARESGKGMAFPELMATDSDAAPGDGESAAKNEATADSSIAESSSRNGLRLV